MTSENSNRYLVLVVDAQYLEAARRAPLPAHVAGHLLAGEDLSNMMMIVSVTLIVQATTDLVVALGGGGAHASVRLRVLAVQEHLSAHAPPVHGALEAPVDSEMKSIDSSIFLKFV